jgi:uncharacterized protein
VATGVPHVAAAAIWRNPTVRRGRPVITAIAGLVAVVGCLATTGPQLAMNGPTFVDLVGTAAGIAGIALLGIAYRVATRGHRRRVHLLGIPILLLVFQFLLVPAFNIGIITHAPKPNIRPAASLGYPGARDVMFRTPDGVMLSAWYVPGTNHAAVILMHGSHGTRESELPYLRFLSNAGYAVVAVDARGHGESGGETNALGWDGDRDVAGAFNFLRRQPGIDRGRIAGLGLSMGAEELLRAAAVHVPLAAVVADGAGASTQGDASIAPRGADAPIYESISWLTYHGVELFSGENAPPALKDIVGRIRQPVLLIASAAPNELTVDRHFAREIGVRASVWHVADVGHTEAYDRHPVEYRSNVLAFLPRMIVK